jgi:4-carboxymuconolactone decarboxylase
MPENNFHSPRITPLEAPFAPEAAAELKRWQPGDLPPIALFRTLVRGLPLAAAMYPLGFYFLGKSSPLKLRDREIVIDRACARCGCEYEWGVHARIFANAAGLDDTHLAATVNKNADWSGWTETDQLLIRMVDELHDSGKLSDDLWASMAALWTSDQLLNLIALAGWYHVISYIANGVRVPLEEFGARFPAGDATTSGYADER